MLRRREGLGQWIGYIIFCGNLTDLHFTEFDKFSNHVKLPLYMFGSGMRSGLLSLCYSSSVVAIQVHRTRWVFNYTQPGRELLDPHSLFCRLRRGYVLGLCCRVCNDWLLEALPAESPTVQCEHVSRLRPRVIRISLETGVDVSRHLQLLVSAPID